MISQKSSDAWMSSPSTIASFPLAATKKRTSSMAICSAPNHRTRYAINNLTMVLNVSICSLLLQCPCTDSVERTPYLPVGTYLSDLSCSSDLLLHPIEGNDKVDFTARTNEPDSGAAVFPIFFSSSHNKTSAPVNQEILGNFFGATKYSPFLCSALPTCTVMHDSFINRFDRIINCVPYYR